MRNLVKTFLIGVLAIGLMACSAEAPGEGSVTATQTATENVAEAVCCGGNCDAPAGTCCADGTCNGSHAELPLAPKL